MDNVIGRLNVGDMVEIDGVLEKSSSRYGRVRLSACKLVRTE